LNCSGGDDKLFLFAAIELGQGEFGSVLKGTWKAPSGELVGKACSVIHLSSVLDVLRVIVSL